MATVIAFYSHKGGVSKTTTAFHLGWKLAEHDYKVLLVDTDPQCNLTSYVIGASEDDTLLEKIYKSKDYETLGDKLKPITDATGDISPAVKLVDTKHENMKLLPGDPSISDFDMYVSLASGTSQKLQFTAPFVGALNECIRSTARVGGFDVILLDLSPSASYFNRSALLSSDYFIIPTSPEFFSYESIRSMTNMIPIWENDFISFRKSPKYPLPNLPPKFLGIISQRFSLTTSKVDVNSNSTERMAKRFKNWQDKIQGESQNLANNLYKYKMSIAESDFQKTVDDELPYNLISISDFRSLAPLSQKYSKPVYALSDKELESAGAVKNVDIKRRDEFNVIFENLANRVIKLTKLQR